MTQTAERGRVFLFLQGPHGPFFAQLGRTLRHTGAEVWRVGFNAGDRAFWWPSATYIPYRGAVGDWPDRVADILRAKRVTDLVLYGDTRTIHATAIAAARAAGVTVHIFEEGYLRPFWVTYERGGSNGNSRLMTLSVAEMRARLARPDTAVTPPPAHWGDMRHHIFYGALYHFFVLCRNGGYRNFRPHRALPVTREFQLHLRRLLLMPLIAADRVVATRRIRRGGFPYHLALLQLEHDSAFQAHSSFATMPDFVDRVLGGFAAGAPRHHHLVFKAHPLEDGRTPLRREIRVRARRYGLAGRVHYVRGGKLARLLDEARSAVTVNSTAAQQALFRGLPLKVFGRAVYDKPDFVSPQPLPDFFAAATQPDRRAYRVFRQYLLDTSQVPGGFYAARARRQLLRQVVDMMLAAADPYDAMHRADAARGQQLRAVP